MPILYERPRRKLRYQACAVSIDVFLPDGKPASLASVTVYEVRKFLWWEYDSYVTSTTADLYGHASLSLTKDRKYHFVFKHITRRLDIWWTLTRCPWYASVAFK